MSRVKLPLILKREADAQEVEQCTVMQVIYSLAVGGGEAYALNIASHLDQRRYRSAICAIDEGGELEKEIRQRKLPYQVMNRSPRFDVSLFWRMYRHFRRHRVQIVHTHHFPQLLYSALGAKLAGADIVHTEHSVEQFQYLKYRLAMRFLSFFCRSVTVVGDELKEFLCRQVGIPEYKITTVYAGVDLERYNEPSASAREALGIRLEDRVISVVARLSPEKNHQLLLRAFAEVVRHIPEARLLIVGSGPEQSRIEATVRSLDLTDRVSLLGLRHDIPLILAATDVFALSSDNEGLPLAILEAIAAGKPVVATDVGSISSVVVDGHNGRLVPPAHTQAFADALTQLLSDPVRAVQMGIYSRALARQYNLPAMVKEFEAIYEGNLNSRRLRRCYRTAKDIET